MHRHFFIIPNSYFDEPTTGLTPRTYTFPQFIERILADDIELYFLSTHIASDIESICDGVAVLNDGRFTISWKYRRIDTAGRWKDISYYAQRNWHRHIKGEIRLFKYEQYFALYTIQNIIRYPHPEEKGKIQSPTLEDGYMYLLHQIEGGVPSMKLYLRECAE